MRFEFEVMKNVDALLMSVSGGLAMAMRNMAQVYSYKGYVLYYQAAAAESDDTVFIVSLVKGEMPEGLIDFDMETGKIESVKKSTSTEKLHFYVIKPELSTLLDKAIDEYKKNIEER
ncbi:MAG: hypothetical protein ACP5UV_02770 [Thermoplasmata archaeon]